MPRKYLPSLCILLVSIFLLNPLSAQDRQWELTTSQGELEVYTRKNSDSKIKEIRIKTTIRADINDLFYVLNDVEGYSEWVYKAINSKKLAQINEDEFYYYTASDFPFPFSNRDLVVLSKRHYNELDSTWYSYSVGKPDFLPDDKGFVRIPSFESTWKIKDIGSGELSIDYQASTNPGGMLPAWIINLGITTGPVKTMTALKNKVESASNAQKWTVEK